VTALAIEIRGLQVRRERRTILSVDQLQVPSGAVLVILGPNGAGKSTLLHCLTGAVRPPPGSVRILGQDVGRLSTMALTELRRRVAHLAQVLAAGSEMPLLVREVVAIGRTGRAGLARPLTRHDWSLVDSWIERLGLQRVAGQSYSALSGGEQRKALLAMAMVQEPEILLLDEPTANLDAYWREQMVATLETLHRTQQLTILLVCHDLEAIPAATRHVLVLRDGRVVAHGPCREVLTQDCIENLYGRGLSVLQHGSRYVLVPQPQEGPA